MRGKLAVTVRLAGVQRNIPAYAGKTKGTSGATVSGSEHPRVCGENLGCGFDSLGCYGTSPRMRGKHQRKYVKGHDFRNIPAYAGKTPTLVFPAALGEEHPRVCGENGLTQGFDTF